MDTLPVHSLEVPPTLSVVLTCYNLGAYLEEALASIPDRADMEVIVVDDGSTDPATQDVVSRLDRSRYTVIEQANMGLARARNNGIQRASGLYILPLDADNRIRPVFLERAISVLDTNPDVGVVYGDAQYFGERTGRWVVGPYDFDRLLRGNYIDACACYRRTEWERAGGYDEHMPYMGWEDWDIWLRFSALGVQFHYVAEVFFDYRVRTGSMIQETRLRYNELVQYIFSKPSLRFLFPVRENLLDRPLPIKEEISGRELLRMLIGRLRVRLFRGTSGAGN